MHSHFPTFSSHTAAFSTPFKSYVDKKKKQQHKSYVEERMQLYLVDYCLLLKIKREKCK